MKKTKITFLVLILVLATCFVTVFGSMANANSKKQNPIVIVNDYEESTDLNSVMMFSVLGKIEIQNDPKYVSYGKASAKITVVKDVYDGNYNHSKPYMYQAMKVEKYGWDYTDFTNIQCVEYDIYNASKEVQRVGTCMRYAYSSVGANEWTELKPESWTTVRYNVTRELLPTTKVGSDVKRIVVGMNLYFDREMQDTVYYVDAMRVYRTDLPVGNAPVGETKENEISSFNEQWQINALATSGGTVAPQFTLSKAFSSDGGASLKVETAASSSSWYYVDLQKAKLYSTLNLKPYGNGDYLCFEIYTPKVDGYTGEVHVYIYTSISSSYVYETVYNLSAGGLIKVRIPLEDINTTQTSLDTGESNVFMYLSQIRLGLKTGVQKFVSYYDNFRIEKGEV